MFPWCVRETSVFRNLLEDGVEVCSDSFSDAFAVLVYLTYHHSRFQVHESTCTVNKYAVFNSLWYQLMNNNSPFLRRIHNVRDTKKKEHSREWAKEQKNNDLSETRSYETSEFLKTLHLFWGLSTYEKFNKAKTKNVIQCSLFQSRCITSNFNLWTLFCYFKISRGFYTFQRS